jgi:hypothetical protein
MSKKTSTICFQLHQKKLMNWLDIKKEGPPGIIVNVGSIAGERPLQQSKIKNSTNIFED